MNKKFLALSLALLMILGTLSVLVPQAHAVLSDITVAPSSGPSGATITVTPTVTVFSPGRSVFALFDTAVADADEGMPLVPFVTTGVVGTESYYNIVGAAGSYDAGEPIYRVNALPIANVKPGDTRLTAVTKGSIVAPFVTTVYAAGSTVAVGDLDIGDVLAALPGPGLGQVWHTGASPFVVGSEIIRDNDASARITPGDQRLNYPSTVVTTAAGIQSYPVNLLVNPNVFDYQEGLYVDTDASGTVSLGDTRSRQYVAPAVRYTAESTILAGDRDAGIATLAFPATVAYADLDTDGAYSPDEWIYTGVTVYTVGGNAGQARQSYVSVTTATGDTAVYLPGSAPAAADADFGTALRPFHSAVAPGPYEAFHDMDATGTYTYGDWIYLTAALPPAALGTAAGDIRLSLIALSDQWNFLGLPAAAQTAQAQVYAIAAVNEGDPDVGLSLVAIPATMKYVGGAAYAPADPIYTDTNGNNLVDAGDVRLTPVSTALAGYAAGGYAAAQAAPGAWLMPGSTVAVGDADYGNALVAFGAGSPNSFSENILADGRYGTEIMSPHYNSDATAHATGFMGPFPVPLVAATAHTAMTFTVPAVAPGNYAILLTTDQSPGVPHAAPWDNIGFLTSGAAFVYPLIGAKNAMTSLPWTAGIDSASAPIFNWNTMGTMAGPAWYLVSQPLRVFLHPGVADPYKSGWSQTLDTYWGTQAHATFGDPSAAGSTYTSNTNWGPSTNRQTRELFEHYLDYAILASSSDSVGDFQFDITVLAPINGIRIYIPGETPGGKGDGFRWLAPTTEEAIWTDITSDYEFIWTSTRGDAFSTIDPYAMRVTIGYDDWSANSMTIWPGTYHIRLFDLAAPKIAGIYHFKIYYSIGGGLFSIGAGNYPIMVVKSELNPAWVMVDVRAHLNVGPLISGQVLAEGTTPEGRTVYAAAWWGPNEYMFTSFVPGLAGNVYRVFILGLAEGTYTLTAQGSGYNPTVSDRITVLAGQSYHMNLVIFDSPDFHVTVWSKHGTGAIPWHNLWQLPFGTNDPYVAPNNLGPRRDMTLELYDSSGNMIGWWASNALGALSVKSIAATNILGGWHDDAVVAPALPPPIPAAVYNGGCIPTSDHYNAWLTDNWDLLGIPRGIASHNPSTHWDGHVPWDTPDYIAGLPQGQYSLESFVTGYIMDEMDAYQRSFAVVGTAISLQMDLRRSNWIETVMHLPDNVFLSTADIAVTLVAQDSSGNERGAAGLSVSYTTQLSAAVVAAGSVHQIDAWWAVPGIVGATATAAQMPNAIPHAGGIVIEGWNNIYPGAGGARTAFLNPQLADYGLDPTKPATDILLYGTSGPEVLKSDGNPYTIKLYMSDMGYPYLTGSTTPHSTFLLGSVRGTGFYSVLGDDPQVSIFLCNSAQLMSFSIVNAWLWISVRSTDFQIPAHDQPWTFPGSGIWIEFKDASGNDAGVLDPTVYGLIQDAGTTVGPPWTIPGAPAGSFGVSPFDIDNVNPAGMHSHVGVFYYGMDIVSATVGGWWGWPFGLIDGWRSTRLVPGQYTYEVHTHGYIMRRSYPVQVPQNLGADIEADVIQGGQIRVTMDFWHEGVATAFNGFIRVEVFDANDNLVGASIYGQADPNWFLTAGSPSPHAAYLPYDGITDWMGGTVGAANAAAVGLAFYGPDSAYNLGPAQAHSFGQPSATYPSTDPRTWQAAWTGARGLAYSPPLLTLVDRGQRGMWSNVFYGVPAFVANPFGQWWPSTHVLNIPWSATSPSDANRLLIPSGMGQSFDVYGFYWYYGDKARTWAGGWPTVSTYAGATAYSDNKWDSGIKGTVDITGWSGSGGGLYTVKVWAFDPRGPNNAYETVLPTDDWRMYSMGWELSNVQVPWGGAQSLYIAMNDMASLRGTVEWVDMFGNARPLAWAMISATNPDTVAYATGNGGIGAGASDPSGAYIMWLQAGTHDVSVSTSEAPNIWSSAVADGTLNPAFTVTVSDGWQGGGLTRLGHQTGVPVPEFPAFLMPLGLFAALAASVWLLRKRNLVNIPVITN